MPPPQLAPRPGPVACTHPVKPLRAAVQPPDPAVAVPEPWPAGLVVAGRRPLQRAGRDVSAASPRTRPAAQPPDPAVAVPDPGHSGARPELLKDEEEAPPPS